MSALTRSTCKNSPKTHPKAVAGEVQMKKQIGVHSMLLLKYMLLLTGLGMVASATAIIIRDQREAARRRRENEE